jgi:hypothetical protein
MLNLLGAQGGAQNPRTLIQIHLSAPSLSASEFKLIQTGLGLGKTLRRNYKKAEIWVKIGNREVKRQKVACWEFFSSLALPLFIFCCS